MPIFYLKNLPSQFQIKKKKNPMWCPPPPPPNKKKLPNRFWIFKNYYYALCGANKFFLKETCLLQPILKKGKEQANISSNTTTWRLMNNHNCHQNYDTLSSSRYFGEFVSSRST
jgi:hypothetical protein